MSEFGDPLGRHNRWRLEEYLEATNLEAVNLNAVNLEAVNLEAVNLEAVDQEGGATGVETLFIG